MIVAVLGAGPHGRAPTRRCVRAGHAVRLYDEDPTTVMDSVDALDRTLDDVAVTDSLDGTTGLQSAVDGADVVVDATDRDLASRRDLLAEVETMLAEDTLVATGGTTVSVTAVAAGLQAPNRAVGLHFPAPTASDVVEVVLADQTTAATRDRATTFVRGLDGVPIVVRDVPGFATARLELASIVEAVRMVADGVATIPDIDRAATRADADWGPLARADAMGLDAVLAGLDDLTARLDARFDPPAMLREAVEAGRLGKPTGEGFYVWTNGEPTRPSELNPAVTARADGVDER
ncbi:3-hydroxyacyl-CoA dehydrogenase family protein [Haloarcula pellucida]|uniref:3-hydroxyacyl-CoA dehydrogenase family protein n=1 Tax=Haloarcula pellucida TaxID=1427151 RepID=UPI00166410CD|nr:3-hydroxyacyl-CoA dehydrogenase family protein [Halomicroarcula pellucida]MBX0347125.1 3-hydroxyacyl-CoA dehydrogenase family protein [Halomicroarcula pellucida]